MFEMPAGGPWTAREAKTHGEDAGRSYAVCSSGSTAWIPCRRRGSGERKRRDPQQLDAA